MLSISSFWRKTAHACYRVIIISRNCTASTKFLFSIAWISWSSHRLLKNAYNIFKIKDRPRETLLERAGNFYPQGAKRLCSYIFTNCLLNSCPLPARKIDVIDINNWLKEKRAWNQAIMIIISQNNTASTKFQFDFTAQVDVWNPSKCSWFFVEIVWAKGQLKSKKWFLERFLKVSWNARNDSWRDFI